MLPLMRTAGQGAIIGATGIASIILFWPVFNWLSDKSALEYSSLHLAALTGLTGLSIQRLHGYGISPFHFPRLDCPAMLLWIPAVGFYLFNEANIGIHILSGTLFVLYLYGLAGHFLDTDLWRSMLLPMLLLILILPFEQHLDVFLGFPLRLLSADWASSLLRLTSLNPMTVESILMIDNRAAIVDLDCSGINSLWIGVIFYLLLTWIERYRLNLRWLLVGLFFLFLLVAANVIRITILVAMELILHLPRLGAVIHQFLGLLCFTAACLLGWAMLRIFALSHPFCQAEDRCQPDPVDGYSIIRASIIPLTIIACTFLYHPMDKASQSNRASVQLASRYLPQDKALTRMEGDFFSDKQARIQKLRFHLPELEKPLTGSMILVWSRNWRNHHVPENCYLGQGYSITDKGVWMLNDLTSVRYVSLHHSQNRDKQNSPPLTGVYWFQSAAADTPDYASRVLAGIGSHSEEWVMASILWDRAVSPMEVSPFIRELKQTLTRVLKNKEDHHED